MIYGWDSSMGVGCILRDGVAKKVDGFGFATISVLDTYRTGSKFQIFSVTIKIMSEDVRLGFYYSPFLLSCFHL